MSVAPATVPPTTAVADILALRGRRGWLSPPLNRVVAAPSAVAAPARTVTLRPGRGGFGPLYDLLSSDDLAGRALVLRAPSDEMAVWGELLSIAATQVGLAAVLVDGAVRDVGECCDLGVPLWSRSTRTVGPAGALEVAAIDEPVEVGEVTVTDGDLVVVDDDGIVALLHAQADTVLADAAAYADAEAAVASALRDGAALNDAYRLKSEAVARLLA